MGDEVKIVEAEVISSTVDEVKVDEKPTRVKGDYSRQIRFFGRLSSLFLSISSPLFFLGIGLGLIFSIIFTDTQALFALVLFSLGFSLAGLALVGIALGFAFRIIMRKYKKKDPNFSDTVGLDEVYE